MCKRSQQVTTCWVFRWEYKGLWDVFYLIRHGDVLFACICVDMWHVVRVHRRNIVGPRFDDCETIEMLALKFDQFQTSSNNFQQVAATCNNTHTFGVQTLATSWAQLCCAWSANNVASVCTGLQNSRQGWNACIVFMGVMLLSTCYNKHTCMQISVCLLCSWSPLVLWNVRLVTLRWGKGKRRVRKLFDSGSTKLDKRYLHI